jgi:hypothetical protein
MILLRKFLLIFILSAVEPSIDLSGISYRPIVVSLDTSKQRDFSRRRALKRRFSYDIYLI